MSAFDPMGFIMDCETLHLYFDGELDTVSALAFEKHLETCAQCRTDLAEFREIRRHLQSELTRMPASDGLRQKIQSGLTDTDEDGPDPPPRLELAEAGGGGGDGRDGFQRHHLLSRAAERRIALGPWHRERA